MNIGVFFRLATTHISDAAATTTVTGVFRVCVHGFTFIVIKKILTTAATGFTTISVIFSPVFLQTR